jgi:hypothetical protein
MTTALAALVMATTAPLTMPRTESIKPPMMTIPMMVLLLLAGWTSVDASGAVVARCGWARRGHCRRSCWGVLAVMGELVVVEAAAVAGQGAAGQGVAGEGDRTAVEDAAPRGWWSCHTYNHPQGPGSQQDLGNSAGTSHDDFNSWNIVGIICLGATRQQEKSSTQKTSARDPCPR